jgi:hypothetical protein
MVEDYTNAFLVSALTLCLLILTAIWAAWGFAAAVFVGWAADRVIVLEAHRATGRR